MRQTQRGPSSVSRELKRLAYRQLSLFRAARAKLYPLFLRSMFQRIGARSVIQPPLHFRDPYLINIGAECIIRRHVSLSGRSVADTGIRLGTGVTIREWTCLDAYGGTIDIADYCSIGHHCVIGGHGGLTIGAYTLIGGMTYIIPSNHVFADRTVPYALQGETRLGVHIGANVWIGACCTILDGVSIGDNCVIGAGSVVAKSIPANTVAFGVPAIAQRRLE